MDNTRMIFCEVALGDSNLIYNYLADSDIFAVDDLVVVPVGADNKESIGRVVSIKVLPPEQGPYPVDKIKHIMRKHTGESIEEAAPQEKEKHYKHFMDMSYQERYEAFFAPICSCLERHHVAYIVHTAQEEDYDHLPDNQYCCYIKICNPSRPDCEYGVRLADEIIFFFNDSHMHVDIYENDDLDAVVAGFVGQIEDVIENRLAGYLLFCGDDWMRGGFVYAEDIPKYVSTPVREPDANLTDLGQEVRLRAKGGNHVFTFWNPEYDREIAIPKREYTYFYYTISKDSPHASVHYIAVNDKEQDNVVLIEGKKKSGWSYTKNYMTVDQVTVQAVVDRINASPAILKCNEEELWDLNIPERPSRKKEFCTLYFADGQKDNSIGDFDFWRYDEEAVEAIGNVYDAFFDISDILMDAGVPAEYFIEQIEDPPFEGYELRDYPRLKQGNPKLSTLGDLFEVLRYCWKAETAYPSDQKDWTPKIPSYGQCAITAMLVYDLFGGEIYRTKDHAHYYNRIDGHWVDLTAEQFWAFGDVCWYDDGEEIERKKIGQSGHTKQRYNMLVKNIVEFLETCIEYPPKDAKGTVSLCPGNWIPYPDNESVGIVDG